jgi:glycosyltransferase involved in cell wall biosynthesis
MIVTISEFSKKEILGFFKYPADKIKVVYCGIDLNTYRPDISEEKINITCKKLEIPREYILYLGTLEPRKNIERLIEAYSLFLDKNKNDSLPVLVIAGGKGWIYESIFKKAKELNLDKTIIFTGYIADEDKPALLAGAICFCFPSLYEGFGLPPLEAMACGTPAVVSNAASLPEVIGDAAIFVDPYNIENLADCIEKLVFDEDLRYKLGNLGLERVKRFSWEKLSEELYKDLVSI